MIAGPPRAHRKYVELNSSPSQTRKLWCLICQLCVSRPLWTHLLSVGKQRAGCAGISCSRRIHHDNNEPPHEFPGNLKGIPGAPLPAHLLPTLWQSFNTLELQSSMTSFQVIITLQLALFLSTSNKRRVYERSHCSQQYCVLKSLWAPSACLAQCAKQKEKVWQNSTAWKMLYTWYKQMLKFFMPNVVLPQK